LTAGYCRARGAGGPPVLLAASVPLRERTDKVIGSADRIGSFSGLTAAAEATGLT